MHGLHIVGAGSFGRIRLAIVDFRHALQVLFDKISPGAHDLHLFKIPKQVKLI